MDLPNTRLWRDDPRPMASPPLIVVPTDIKPAVVLEAVKVWAWQGRSTPQGWGDGLP